MFTFGPNCQRAADHSQRAVFRRERQVSQAAMRDHLEACGFDYLCTDSTNQAIAWLTARGVLEGRFELL
jgi:hypothetical protein